MLISEMYGEIRKSSPRAEFEIMNIDIKAKSKKLFVLSVSVSYSEAAIHERNPLTIISPTRKQSSVLNRIAISLMKGKWLPAGCQLRFSISSQQTHFCAANSCHRRRD